MIGNKIGHRLDPFLSRVVNTFFGNHGTPNFFTLLGLLAALVASWLIIADHWFLAGLALILSGVFDLFDGAVARNQGKVTLFGGFFDSVMDRYSDLFFLLALLIYYLERGDTLLVVLIGFVSIGTGLISYTRARAEASQIQCSVGLMERAERIILLTVGCLFHWMEPVLWVLAFFTHFTVVQRIYHVWSKLRAS